MMKALLSLFLMTAASLAGERWKAEFTEWTGPEMEARAWSNPLPGQSRDLFEARGVRVKIYVPKDEDVKLYTFSTCGYGITKEGGRGAPSVSGEVSSLRLPPTRVVEFSSAGLFLKDQHGNLSADARKVAVAYFRGWSVEMRASKKKVLNIFASTEELRRSEAARNDFKLPKD